MNDFPKLAAPAQRALANAGLKKLSDLKRITQSDFKNLHGIGPNAFKQIRKMLNTKGLDFKKPSH